MTLYGFHTLQDLASARITGSLIEATNTAINAAVTEHNRVMDALIALFCQRTTEYKRRYAQIGSAKLQSLDENGRARPIKPSGYYDVAFPIEEGGAAWGANYVSRAKMTVGDAERITAMMLQADALWVRDRIMAGLFSDTAWTFTDPLYGALTIETLANGDTVTYLRKNGTASTDDHQLGMANAIGSGSDNPFPTIYDELTEHPENRGQVISFIPAGLKATVSALSTFIETPDGNVILGSGSNRLAANGPGVAVPGTIIGYETSGVWIAQWDALPANYILSVTTEGPRALAMREDPEPELQGFKKVAERNDHPFYENQFLRRAGFGAWNRVGAHVTEISDASYDVPTGYVAPIV